MNPDDSTENQCYYICSESYILTDSKNYCGGDTMKISFSTLGCPGWGWNDILATAKDLGYDGIEVRGIGNELYVPNAKPFLDQNIENTSERLKKLGLTLPCLTSDVRLFDKVNPEKHRTEAREYIDLASKLGVRYVRVLGDAAPQPGPLVDEEFVADSLAELARYAEEQNVTVLIETNGMYADSKIMCKLMNHINSKHAGVLWDIHHPYRYIGEKIEDTYRNLKDYIRLVHVKDSIVENRVVRYKMAGHGDVPVKEAVHLLKEDGYEGFVSLEWVKRWCIELEEPGVVFSHFASYMKGKL